MLVKPFLEVLSGADVSVGATLSDNVDLVHDVSLSASSIHRTVTDATPAVTVVLGDVFSLEFNILAGNNTVYIWETAVGNFDVIFVE